MVKELEARVHQLTVEAETSHLQHQKLSQEKNNLEQSYQVVSLELEEIKARHNSLQKEKGCMMEEHKENIKQLQSQYEVDLNLMKKEHALSAMKTSDVTEDLKLCVSELEQQLLELDHQRQQQLQEQEQMFLEEKADLERIHDKKIYGIQSDFDKERTESHKKIRKLEDLLREREEHLTQVMEAQKLQAQQADAALEEFTRQVEMNSEKVYAEMKEKVRRDLENVILALTEFVERGVYFIKEDLEVVELLYFCYCIIQHKLEAVVQAQSGSCGPSVEEMDLLLSLTSSGCAGGTAGGGAGGGAYGEIVELKLEHEQEKTHLFQEHNTEKDCLVRDHEREIEKLEKQLRAAMTDYDNKTQEYRKRDAQIICDMEGQIHTLKEELIQVNTQRKQQLVELSLLREEEKQRAARDHEAAMNKKKAESEKMILDLKKTNAVEKEMVLEKANDKLKQIEKEYSQKLAKSSQIIAELQTTVSSLTEESNQRQLAGERRLQDVLQKFEDEKQQLIRNNDTAIKGLQYEIESYHNQVHSAEEKLQQKDLEAQEQVTSIRQEYETKMKGLMPASLRQELEDTILSLKSQVTFLQKRASILQDELSTYRTRR
ncbi:PREDICTED: centrosomal protein of 112 kDa-like [Thamnophis sirtalis]|uniref:Centrosomal protein of 112 kDa-like n=1 Tax=Thamnophis sirtalis TaxID=35019 RepID=A0A6I9XM25_9SAUR|nr:PREDICTED: centrosomal protein of 112 kDa-like [Thamnophis sirtalis]